MAFLARREQMWTLDLGEAESRRRGAAPEEQLLAIFDVFDEWFRSRAGFDECSFINVLIELHRCGDACIQLSVSGTCAAS